MSRSRITIRDVAAHAGVSHQTVSRVINNSSSVRPATRARVEQAIAELGYRPNEIARFMARGRTGTLACLSPNLTDYSYASIIESAQAEARRHDYYLLTAVASDQGTFARLIDELVTSGRTEGLLVINPYSDEREVVLPPHIPAVVAGAHTGANSAVSSVVLDDMRVGELATDHLLKLGHRRIGLITGPLSETCAQERQTGYEQALQRAELTLDVTLVTSGDWSAESGYEAMQLLMQGGASPSAVFVQNDRMAVGVLRAAQDMGLRVPEDLSLVSVDDIPLASYFAPPLTSVRQDFGRIGRDAARLLIDAIAKPQDAKPQRVRITPELMVRRSTAAWQDADPSS